MSYPLTRIGPTQYGDGGRVDLYEASVVKRCADVQIGDHVPVSWSEYHVVTDIKHSPRANDTRWVVTLRESDGDTYTAWVRSLRVVQP